MTSLEKAIEYVRSFQNITLERIQEADTLFNLGPGDAVHLRHRFCFW